MPQNIKWIIGDEQLISQMDATPAFETFDECVLSFLSSLSGSIIKDQEAKQYSDVITFGFWIRRASLEHMKKKYAINSEKIRMGRGISFHIAPSNIPINFAYSLVASLLAGNANMIRLSSKEFVEANVLCRIITETLERYPILKSYILICKYEHSQEVTTYFSKLCDNRIIWGGDETIQTIRKSPLKSNAKEITFADRFSVSVINSEAYLALNQGKAIAEAFYNDTFLNDQNACTSPRMVIWTGSKTDEARRFFWDQLNTCVIGKYQIKPIQNINKLTSTYFFGALLQNKYGAALAYQTAYITCIEVNALDENLMNHTCSGGFFYEYCTSSLDDILPICSSKLQTLSHIGLEKEVLREFLKRTRPKGIDRIVEIGKTLDFDLEWDGVDLICELSRILSI